jgi:hypothetical protein
MKTLITGVVIILLSLCGTFGWWNMTHNPSMDFKVKEVSARSELMQYNLLMMLYLMDHNNTFPKQMTRENTIRVLQAYMKFEDRQNLSKGNVDDLLFKKLGANVVFNQNLAGRKVVDLKPVVWVSVHYKDYQGHPKDLNAWSNGETNFSDNVHLKRN